MRPAGWSARAQMCGPLVGYVAGYEAQLAARGYAPGSVLEHARMVAALDGWLDARGLDATALMTDDVVEEFIAQRRAARAPLRSPRALEPLLTYLRAHGVAALPATATRARVVAPAEVLLDRYRRFLVVQRGVTQQTAGRYVRIVGGLVSGRQRGDELDLATLDARDVTTFLLARSRMVRGRDAVTALRSLLGFLASEGIIDGDLVDAVPSVASWRLAGVPQTLAAGQVQLLLDSCDRASVKGRRDFAILTVLSRLGLRCGEVAALSLDDLHWRAGEIRVPNGKRGRHDTLPLPVDVGEAIASYLRDGRPAHAEGRSVFVRCRAPRGTLSSGGISAVVVRAGRRAGVAPVGAQRLRHTVASDILRAGAGLGEVGEVLRHQWARTTAIYAKVDLTALREIARPWPEPRS